MNHIPSLRYLQRILAISAVLATGCSADGEVEDDNYTEAAAQQADGTAGFSSPAPEVTPRAPSPGSTCSTTNRVSVTTAKLRQILGPPFDAEALSVKLYPSRDGHLMLVTAPEWSSSAKRATVHISPSGELVPSMLPTFDAEGTRQPLDHRELIGFVARATPADQLIRVVRGSRNEIAVQAFGPDSRLGPVRPIFEIDFPPRLLNVALGTSLDASRTVLAMASILGGSLHAAVVGADGAPVGSTHDIAVGTARAQCLQTIPTEHAAALSYVARSDGAVDLWHVVEFDREGKIVLESTHPAAGCPTEVGSSRTHFAARFATTPAPSFVRVARHQRTPVATSTLTWPSSSETPLLGIVPTATGTLLVNRSWNSGELHITRLGGDRSAQGLYAPTIPYGATTLLPSTRGDFELSVSNEQGVEIFTIACPDEKPTAEETEAATVSASE